MTCSRYAVLVTGSRGWTDSGAIERRLLRYCTALQPPKGSVLLHGDAEGADLLADQLARAHDGWIIERTPYFDWLGKAGGPARNRFLVQKLQLYRSAGYRCHVEAFDLGTPGTGGCVRLCEQAGFAVHVTRP